MRIAFLRSGKSIGQSIDESPEFYGMKTQQEARDIVRRARERSALSAEQAQALANKEVRAGRRRRLRS